MVVEGKKVSPEEFQAMVDRAGYKLSPKEFEDLKRLYDQFAGPIAELHELDLGAEDMAVAFSPDWPSAGEDEQTRQ